MIAQQIRANGWGKDFTLLSIASADEGGFIGIQGGGRQELSMAPAGQTQTVPAVRLDDVVALNGRRARVPMDVEGSELAALQGAAQILAKNPRRSGSEKSHRISLGQRRRR